MEESLRFKLVFDTSEYRRGIRAVKRDSQGLARGISKDVEEAEDRTRRFSRSLQGAARNAKQTGRQMRAFGDAASGVNSRVGRSVRTIGRLTTVFAGVATVGGPASLAVALVTTALIGTVAAAASATSGLIRVSRAGRETYEELEPLFKDGFGPSPNALQTFDETTAALDAVRSAARATGLVLAEQFAPELQQIARYAGAAVLMIEEISHQTRDFAQHLIDNSRAAQNVIFAYQLMSAVTQDNTKSSKEHARAQRTLRQRFEDNLKRIDDLIKEQFKLNETNRTAKDRAKALREEQRRLREEERKRLRQMRLAQRLQDEVAGIERNAARATMSEGERIRDIYQERLDRLREIAQQTAGGIDVARAEAAEIAALEHELTELQERQRQEREQAEREAHERAMARERERREQAQQTLDQVSNAAQRGLQFIGTSLDRSAQASQEMVTQLTQQLAAGEDVYTEAQKKALRERIEAQKNAAREQFEAAQKAKVAEALASTALASINAIAQSPPPSPLGLIGAGIATAAGLTAAQQIASQNVTFHRGGLGDEIPATLTRREAVLSPLGRQTAGDDNIRRMNSGRRTGEDRILVVDRYRHQTFNRFIKDGLRMGNPISDAIGRDDAVGHNRERKGI